MMIKKILNKYFGIYIKFSFSQAGEDLIIKFIIDSLKIKEFTYLDIGANHPYNMNNTYLLYSLGFSGVCIEPNPLYFKQIKSQRKRDICLNVGVGVNGLTEGDYYNMNNSLLKYIF